MYALDAYHGKIKRVIECLSRWRRLTGAGYVGGLAITICRIHIALTGGGLNEREHLSCCRASSATDVGVLKQTVIVMLRSKATMVRVASVKGATIRASEFSSKRIHA